jgi:hypothetical protein
MKYEYRNLSYNRIVEKLRHPATCRPYELAINTPTLARGTANRQSLLRSVLIGIIAQKEIISITVYRFPTISVAVFIYGLQMYARRLGDAECDATNFRLLVAHTYKYRNADGQCRQR